MEPIKLRTTEDDLTEIEKNGQGISLGDRITHDLRIIHSHKDEINAALRIMPLVREWAKARRAALAALPNLPLDAEFLPDDDPHSIRLNETETTLSAALARVEEGEKGHHCGCCGNWIPGINTESGWGLCDICNGTGKEKP